MIPLEDTLNEKYLNELHTQVISILEYDNDKLRYKSILRIFAMEISKNVH